MVLSVAVLIAAGLAVLVVAPMLSAEGSGSQRLPIDVTPLADLKRRRLVVYENLKDLEFEYQAGKIAGEDYQSLRTNYLGEAAALMMASQDAVQTPESEAWVEGEVAARRASRKLQPPEEYVCPKCGFRSPCPAKFCAECGARIVPSSPKS